MSIELWFAFAAASAVLLIIPGPTILTVISYSIAHGRRANVPLVAAVALGDSTALVVSLLGLGALLATSAFWFTVVKSAGGLYLLYLGIKLLRAGISPSELLARAVPGSRWKLFANTYLVTALNPKGIVFFVAFLPQFINPGAGIAQQPVDTGRDVRGHGYRQCNVVRSVREYGSQGAFLVESTTTIQLGGWCASVRRRCLGAACQASGVEAANPSLSGLVTAWRPSAP